MLKKTPILEPFERKPKVCYLQHLSKNDPIVCKKKDIHSLKAHSRLIEGEEMNMFEKNLTKIQHVRKFLTKIHFFTNRREPTVGNPTHMILEDFRRF